MRVVATGLALLLALGGCAGTDLQPPTPAASPAPVSDPAGMRRAAGLPECDGFGTGGRVEGGLPELTLRCLGGDGGVSMASLRGPALVNLWAAWCGPCRQEGPILASFAKAYEGRVRVVGVDTADPDRLVAAQFAASVGWRYVQLEDPGHALPDALGVKGLPVTVFVDASGRVVYRHLGAFSSEQQIRELVASQLGVTG